jgi:uncharacterized membrane protein
LSKIYQAKTIFVNATIGAIATIIEALTLSFTLKINVWPSIPSTSWYHMYRGQICLVILIVALIVAALFIMRSLNELTNHSDITEFATSGRYLLFGTITIIIGIIIPFAIVYLMPYTFTNTAASFYVIFFGATIIVLSLLTLLIAFFKLKNLKIKPFTAENLFTTDR